MNLLIVEDEEQAAKRLKRQLKTLYPQAYLHGPMESVADAVMWLQDNPHPDLIMLDIHLADGLSFEIFEMVKTSSPVIFTTAYDQYAIRAFKLNSIDYLLKPIEEAALKTALAKWEKNQDLILTEQEGGKWYESLKNDYVSKYKLRFMSRVGDRLQAIETKDVSYAFSENRGTYLHTFQGKKHLIDFSLEQLEALLNPAEFFRLNRKYMGRYEAVDKMVNYSNSRLKVSLKECADSDIVLSREKSKAFKAWLDR